MPTKLDALPDPVLHDIFSRLDFETRHEPVAAGQLSPQDHVRLLCKHDLL